MRRKKQFSQRNDHFIHPEADASLKQIFLKIGKPPENHFEPDLFQIEALKAIEQSDCLVTAPTGSGKTWIAEQAMHRVLRSGGRCWYASPLKALSNAKWVEFGDSFNSANVGILTGDTKENTEAPIIVGTTEIFRNQLYDAMHKGRDLPCDLVILDEAHFLGDRDRGVAWEEIMIYLPARIPLLMLSATIGNASQIAAWLSAIRGKACRVIAANRRPVPLYPLFLHPSGRLMPFVQKKEWFPGVRAYIENDGEGRRKYRRPFNLASVLDVLEAYRLLPAVFFLKSRTDCDDAIKKLQSASSHVHGSEFAHDLAGLLERFPYLRGHRHLNALMTARIAAHHGGQLPAWKFLIEEMMKRGHLRAIFATSTVAAGVNFPARTIVLLHSDQFDGHEFKPLSSTAFHQMTGRAGRRGQDRIGFMLLLPGRFMDLHHIRRLLRSGPDDIVSQIRNDFSMVLNLLLSQTPDDIQEIFRRSFATYYQQSSGRQFQTAEELWLDFRRHLDFLKAEGFVDSADHLTEDGVWASRLRLDHPLMIAEGLKRRAFPSHEAPLFAAVVAPFVYDGEQELSVRARDLSPNLRAAFRHMVEAIKPLASRLKAAGFKSPILYPWTAAVMSNWAYGATWDKLVRDYDIADGDLAMLISRTADNLRQITSLRDSHPRMSSLAARAREAILREPMFF